MGEVLKQMLAVPDQRLEETKARCREGSAGRGLPEVGQAVGWWAPGVRRVPRENVGCVSGRKV